MKMKEYLIIIHCCFSNDLHFSMMVTFLKVYPTVSLTNCCLLLLVCLYVLLLSGMPATCSNRDSEGKVHPPLSVTLPNY